MFIVISYSHADRKKMELGSIALAENAARWTTSVIFTLGRELQFFLGAKRPIAVLGQSPSARPLYGTCVPNAVIREIPHLAQIGRPQFDLTDRKLLTRFTFRSIADAHASKYSGYQLLIKKSYPQ